MEEHYSTFLDYTTLSGFNTMINCSTSRPNAIALQHISSQHYCLVDQYYCLVALYYTITHSVTYKYDTLEPMECTQRSIALLFVEYDILLRPASCP